MMAFSQVPPIVTSVKVRSMEKRHSRDRRRAARVSVLIPVRLRPVKFGDGNFEDVTSTLNISRGCLYVTTWRETYYQGMRVMVTYPYLSSKKSTNWEYLGEVARVEQQGDGRFRLAVRLQFVMQPTPNPRLVSL
ncbi:MAG: hypothetical protein WBC04_09390 [Candidatus Acidiferrales bacterium]